MLACVLAVLDDFNIVSRILLRTSICCDWVFLCGIHTVPLDSTTLWPHILEDNPHYCVSHIVLIFRKNIVNSM